MQLFERLTATVIAQEATYGLVPPSHIITICNRDFGGLTITHDYSILPVVAVVDTPAGETAVLNATLVPPTVDVVHPDDTAASLVVTPRACPEGVIETKHSGMEWKQTEWSKGG